MADQRDEGIIDKLKDAVGLGDDDDAPTVDDRDPGFAGVGEMMDDRDDDLGTGGTMGRSAGTGLGTEAMSRGVGDDTGGTGMNPDADSTIHGEVGTANRPAGPDDADDDEGGIGTDGTARGL